mgnify:CR=1 FL=1
MAQTLLITEDYVYQNTQINDSVEAAKIYPYIRLAQDKWLEPFTGTELLNKIKTDAAAGTIAGNYLILLDEYLRPLLVWRTCHELLPNINPRIASLLSPRALSKKLHTSAMAQSGFRCMYGVIAKC